MEKSWIKRWEEERPCQQLPSTEATSSERHHQSRFTRSSSVGLKPANARDANPRLPSGET